MTRVRELVFACTVSAAVAIAATGCHKNVAPPAPAPPPPPPPTAPATPPPPAPPPPAAQPTPARAAPQLTDEQLFAQKTLAQLNAEKPLADVYFDLDESTLRDDAKAPLQRDADWMKRWTSTQVTVEGHADERGSAEYNLALGERRAQTVKEYLVSLGIPAGRVTVVSKGKEQPVCTQHDESCWQQNRRGHFVVTAK